MISQSLYHTYKRYRSLQTHTITALPIVILMPHSACNCRCIMCDIWKGNKNLKQLSEADVEGLLSSLKRLGTKQVVMSGGEALLNPNFFSLCRLLKKQQLYISLLSTGLAIKKNADDILKWVDEVIVSLDGDEETHDKIRNVSGAYAKLSEGVQHLKARAPGFKISARTVIHRLNFRKWPAIIDSAKEMGVDRISFLPADVSSHAFNREVLWTEERQLDIAINENELSELKYIIDEMIRVHAKDFHSRFIAESPEKLNKIFLYYSAVHQLCEYPYKKCNAPWVSAVVEADGTVRPCFFHEAIGNIRENSLTEILNGEKGTTFRRSLNMDENDTCRRCVCYLNLPAGTNPIIKK
jgi:MoaA/NifB/PqqE/SkfB family radical SAM enzyme